MKKSDFQKVLRDTHTNMLRLTASKGQEYSRDEDQLANFKRCAAECDITMQQAWSVLFTKHIDAIKFFIKNGRELSEPIEGRIDDAILYLILLKAIVQESRCLDQDQQGPDRQPHVIHEYGGDHRSHVVYESGVEVGDVAP